MKRLISIVLLFSIVGCSEQSKEMIVLSPLEIIIDEDNVTLKLDATGVIYQNEEPLGKIEGNKINDLKGNNIFTISEDYVVTDANNDSVTNLSNKRICLDDSFLGVFTWSAGGQLKREDAEGMFEMEVGIQLIPNDSLLYRTASLVVLFGEEMKKGE